MGYCRVKIERDDLELNSINSITDRYHYFYRFEHLREKYFSEIFFFGTSIFYYCMDRTFAFCRADEVFVEPDIVKKDGRVVLAITSLYG